MTTTVDLDIATRRPELPSEQVFQLWANQCISALGKADRDYEISMRLVDSDEIAALNKQYRGKSGSTNVLSFPADLPESLELPLLGDIVICPEVVENEAVEQNKSLVAHWAHMTIHGLLHLLGYDHITDQEATEMESIETRILLELGYPAPYADEL